MNFPMGVLCLFIGAVLVWVASHGTSATSPWTLFQQVLAGFSGQPATATKTPDPWDAVGQAGVVAGQGAADAAGAVGSSLSHRSGHSSSSGSQGDAIDSAIRNFRANSKDTTAQDNADIVAAQQQLRHIQNDLDGTGPVAWP